jgi:exonuclease III
MNIKEHDIQGRVLSIVFSEFTLVSVYVPGSGDNLQKLEYRVN